MDLRGEDDLLSFLVQLGVSSLGDLLEFLGQLGVGADLFLNLCRCLLSREELLNKFNSSISSLLVLFKFFEELENFKLIRLSFLASVLGSKIDTLQDLGGLENFDELFGCDLALLEELGLRHEGISVSRRVAHREMRASCLLISFAEDRLGCADCGGGSRAC